MHSHVSGFCISPSLHFSLHVHLHSSSSRIWFSLQLTWQVHAHSTWSCTSCTYSLPSSESTLKDLRSILVGSHFCKTRGRRQAPLQRFTLTNWGIFFRAVTSGSTWTTSGYGAQGTSGSCSPSGKKKHYMWTAGLSRLRENLKNTFLYVQNVKEKTCLPYFIHRYISIFYLERVLIFRCFSFAKTWSGAWHWYS